MRPWLLPQKERKELPQEYGGDLPTSPVRAQSLLPPSLLVLSPLWAPPKFQPETSCCSPWIRSLCWQKIRQRPHLAECEWTCCDCWLPDRFPPRKGFWKGLWDDPSTAADVELSNIMHEPMNRFLKLLNVHCRQKAGPSCRVSNPQGSSVQGCVVQTGAREGGTMAVEGTRLAKPLAGLGRQQVALPQTSGHGPRSPASCRLRST